jgi:hypothetical protein
MYRARLHSVETRAPVALFVLLALACSRGDTGDSFARGHGLKTVALPPSAEARVIEAAVRASFDVGPDLVLLLHPRRLPRTAGYEGGDPVPSELVRALRARGVVRGTCEPQRDAPRNTPRCDVPQAGYIVRASDVLRVGADTVELYFAAERFGPATGQRPEALRFEKIYQLVGRDAAWRVVREARSPQGGS